jgi:hypothetical protein
MAGAEGAAAALSDRGAQACFQIVGEARVGAGGIDRLRQCPDRIFVQKLQARLREREHDGAAVAISRRPKRISRKR